MASPNIFSQYLQPVRSPLDYANDLDRRDLMQLQLQGQQRQNALADLAFGNQQAEIQQRAAEGNALRNIAARSKKPEEMIANLRGSGMPGLMQRADALETQALARRKTESEIGEKTVLTDNAKAKGQREAADKARQFVLSLPDKKSLIDSLNAAHDIPFQERAMLVNSAPDDPQAFQLWKQQRLLPALSPKEQLGAMQPEFKDTGAQMVNVNPLAGNVAPMTKGMTPGEMASNKLGYARLAQEKALQQGALTYQTDANGNLVGLPTRAGGGPIVATPVRDASGASIPGKDSGLNDTQAKALLFGTRMGESNKILEGMSAKGIDMPSILSQATGGSPLVNWAQSPEQQQVDQAQRDFINATLRRESGAAISASEFDNAAEAILPASW